jgi:NAD(P)-dependent dehydrogenase (short-subunit alcohol dehydrogenase family)
MTLKDKRVAVLGGTSGIGLAIADGVAAAGGTPIVVSKRPESVQAALARLPGAEGHAADLTQEADIAALFEKIGAIDHLTYTAADKLVTGPLADADLAAARDYLNARFWGPLTVAKYAAPRIRPGGSIVFTSGIAGARPPGAGWVLGAALCSAMEGLTRALAIELAPLRVNIVSPGFVDTPIWNDIPEADRKALFKTVGDKLPVGHVAQPEEVAAAYLYLMQASFTTGQTLVTDGGSLLV